MEYQDATRSEPPDVSATDQAPQQQHLAPDARQPDRAAPAAAAEMQHGQGAPFWAPAAAGLADSSGSLPDQGPLLGPIPMSGLVAPMELEAPVESVDPISTAGHMPGLWSGSNSRGTTPSSTTSSGGRLQPRMDRQASEPVLRGTTPGSGSNAPGSQQRCQLGGLAYGGLSLPASPTMLQYQQYVAAGGMRSGYSNLSSPSSGSWPDVDLGSGSLLGSMQQAAQGNDSGGEGDAGMLVPSGGPLLQQEPGLPLGLQLHIQPQAQQAEEAAARLLRPPSPVLGGQQQQQQQQHLAGAAALGPDLAHQLSSALRRQQQQDRDAQLMPPPPPPTHARGQSPSSAAAVAAAAVAAAAAAADAAARASARPPPLVIPSTSALGSQQAAATSLQQQQQQQQLPPLQQPAHQQQQQQQQQAYLPGFERPGSAPTPSPAYPRSSTTITPSMLNMGLETPVLAAGGGSFTGTAPYTYGSTASDSKGLQQRRQRRPKSLPSSPAIAPAAAAAAAGAPATSSGGEYSSTAGILSAGAGVAASPLSAAQQHGAAGAAGGLCATAAATLVSAGRFYIKVQCGVQFGWMDVRDSLVIVDVGTKKERKLTFAKFEALGGRGATRKWRTSIMALPDGPGDTWVPRTMPLGELLRRLNTEIWGTGQDSNAGGNQQQGQLSGAPAGGSGSGLGSTAAAAAAGVSPQPRYSAAAAAAAGLVSPGQRRRREEPEDAEGARPTSVEPYSRDEGFEAEDEGLEGYAISKRVRASQEGVLSQPGSQQSSQQQQQPAGGTSGGMSWLTSPCSTGTAAGGLSISAGGPLPSLWATSTVPPASAAGTAGSGTPGHSSTGLLLPPQPPPQQQQQETQQQRRQQAYEQELPAVMLLTPPEQLVAAMQPPPMPGSSVGSSQRSRRGHASTAGSGGGVSGAGAAGTTPPSSQSPRVTPAGASSAVMTGQQSLSGGPWGRQSSEEPRPQQQQQQQSQSHQGGQQRQQLSATGRPIRQQSRRSVSAAAAAAARLDSYERDSGPVSYAGGLRFLQVYCDQLPGNLDLQRMMVIPQAGEREGQPMSLSQFEILGGRGSARKWRRSVSVEDEGHMISLGDWLEKYAEQPGSEGTAPTYSRYSAGSKQRSATVSPGVAGAAAAAAAAAGLSGSSGWQQRDQGPGAVGGRAPAQGRRVGGVLTVGVEDQGQGPEQEKQGSPVLDDFQGPGSQAVTMSDVHGGPQLQQQSMRWDIQSPTLQQLQPQQDQPMQLEALADLSAAARGQGMLPYGPGAAAGGAPPAAADSAAAGAVPGSLPQQQQLPPASASLAVFGPVAPHLAGQTAEGPGCPGAPPPAAAAAGAAATTGVGASGVSLGMGDGNGGQMDLWSFMQDFFAQDAVSDAHLHPAQLDVDMADQHGRSPLMGGQQTYMIASPTPGSTAAAAAAGASAILQGFSAAGPGQGVPQGSQGVIQAGYQAVQDQQEQQQLLLQQLQPQQQLQPGEGHGFSQAGQPSYRPEAQGPK